VAKVVRACQELPGQRLFQYRDEDGELREVTSSDVNAYLREITAATSPPRISAPGPAP
jgi:DNA topoisomerase-1